MKMVCFYLQVYSSMPDDRLERKRKGVKIGMQCGKRITDSRFYKPPK